jgi:hypothetical protein
MRRQIEILRWQTALHPDSFSRPPRTVFTLHGILGAGAFLLVIVFRAGGVGSVHEEFCGAPTSVFIAKQTHGGFG